MFFVMSKILGLLLLPSNILIGLGLLGLLLAATRFARFGRRLAAFALFLLAILGFTPLGNALILPLEQRFPAWDPSRGAPDGIIVLGGAISAEVSAARGMTALNEAAERMTIVAELARRFPAAQIVFTGGSANLIFPGAPEAAFVMLLFESFGIARERIRLESRSRTTAENATFAKALVIPRLTQRWLLVTSAAHMPRSIGVFRQAGFIVEAYPVDWRTAGWSDLATPFSALSAGLARTDAAAHEWFGLLAYWIGGRSSELFPAPDRR
ncbi:MAG: YdcF family protein [Rhizobiales bacterium]|nr:YdcF family protein [Hyphomicrobiales bacterium]